MIPLPSGWTEKTIWDPTIDEVSAPPESVDDGNGNVKGVLGYHNKSKKIIELYPRWWLSPIWWFLGPLVRKHEVGHAYGITQCIGSKKWCVMFEDNDDWESKFQMLFIKIYGMGKFCPECKEHMKKYADI